ncbi:MAG: glycosyltransferase family 39 protein [Phycisphaerae bacterium]|nr:glycosyltransferase family 39 protein [Phycisphaerae bacterium]
MGTEAGECPAPDAFARKIPATAGGESPPEVRRERDRAAEPTSRHYPLSLLVLAAMLATVTAGFVASASRVVVTPDSAAYIDLAIGIIERGDLSDDRFQFYTPGYPLFLASVFALFGNSSGIALLLIQHAMVVGCAILATCLAWLVRPGRALALATALFVAASPYLGGYANAVLSEVPYTLLLTGSILALAWHLQKGGTRALLTGSVLAGLATWLRPTGQLMILACAGVAVGRIVKETETLARIGAALRAFSIRLLAATAPAATLLLAIALNNYRTQGVFDLTCNDDMCYYVRAFAVEHLPPPDNEAMISIRNALEITGGSGDAIRDDYQHPWAVIAACRQVYGMSYPQAGRLMREAATPALYSEPRRLLRNTLVYSYRNLMIPDGRYLMIPGLSTEPSERGTGGRAAVLDADHYRPFVEERIGAERLGRYLELRSDPTPTTAIWSKLAAGYHRRIESGPPWLGLLDTPFEELRLLIVAGVAWLLWARRWGVMALLGFVICYHIVLSSFFGGVEPRYAIPLQPLWGVLSALGIFAMAGMFTRVLASTGYLIRKSPAFSPSGAPRGHAAAE